MTRRESGGGSGGGLRLVSVYQPSWGAEEAGMKRCRRDMNSQVAMEGRERLVREGDFNASVGKDAENRGVWGKRTLGRSNDAGRDLIEWCEEHGLARVNGHMEPARRGTWRNQASGRWYKQDGLVVRGNKRHHMARGMRTKDAFELSDHRPVCMRVNERRE